MKSAILIFSLLIFWSVNSNCQNEKMASSEKLQKWISLKKEATRAKTDKMILIVIVKVKGQFKVEFEKWIKDVLYKALYRSESEMKKAQLKTTRFFAQRRTLMVGRQKYLV